MDIDKILDGVLSKFKTRDPFEIADMAGILVFFEELGALRGYYNAPYGVKMIHINSDLPRIRQRLGCAHEIAHSFMHPELNVSFMTKNTFMQPGKYERQANIFASKLLLPDEKLAEFYGYTAKEIACITGLPKEAIEIRTVV